MGALYVIVVGAGAVGSNIAADLSGQHEVVVVERDPDLVDQLTYELDVLTVRGDGTAEAVLAEADVERADMLIACTDSDEANVLACATATTMADPFTIARVKRTDLLETWQGSEGAFAVDFMVCTDLLTAETVVRIATLSGAVAADAFADGLVRMAEFVVPEDSPIAGETVGEADRWDSLTFAAIVRGEEVVVPRGDSRIEAGDNVVVIGLPEALQAFSSAIHDGETLVTEEVVVVGGGEIGFQTARLFVEHGATVTLLERDPERAREVAEALPDVVVHEHDATDMAFLEREYVGEADVVVGALGTDEKNLLVSLLADRIGADRTVAVVEEVAYVELFEAVGVDVAVNPRTVTAEEITRFTRERRAENVAILEGDRAEVLEFAVEEGGTLADRTIAAAVEDLPDGVVVGAIVRDGDYVEPRGETTVRAGDAVVLFVDTDVLEEIDGQL